MIPLRKRQSLVIAFSTGYEPGQCPVAFICTQGPQIQIETLIEMKKRWPILEHWSRLRQGRRRVCLGV